MYDAHDAHDAPVTAQPEVSVIVPCYNAASTLRQCLTSIVNQTHRGLEVICLNDGSTDGSLAIMREYAAHDPRVKVIDKENEGYGATCNRGIDESRGAYVAIVEPDDWVEPGMYGDMLAFAAGFPEPADIIKTPYWRIWMPDSPQQRKLNCTYRRRVRPPAQPFVIGAAPHLLCHHPSIWSALYRKEFLDGHGIRFMPIPGAGWADNPFLIETLCQAQSIIYLDTPYYCYRVETPEQFAASTRANILLPLHRWHDQMDVIDRLGISNTAVLCAQNRRGFTYLQGVVETVGFEDPSLRALAERMFSRMDVALVVGDPQIATANKRLFLEARALPPQRLGRLAHVMWLLAQGLYSLRNTGIGYTAQNMIGYLVKARP